MVIINPLMSGASSTAALNCESQQHGFSLEHWHPMSVISKDEHFFSNIISQFLFKTELVWTKSASTANPPLGASSTEIFVYDQTDELLFLESKRQEKA